MIIPRDAIIPIEKVRDYLLKPLEVDDKSGFLALAGYSREDYWELIRDIREQLLPAEAEYQGNRGYGNIYAVRGILVGPNTIRLAVSAIWILNLSDEIRFVTLQPDKERYHNEIRTF
ncbi:MAG TPA: hypothetical protein VFD13_04415 [Candidatus Kapabacteria bacterium]|nr:hypothetical protein [Candidatus Kapabacteria bacterium]